MAMINLKESYGKRYKVFMDEAWECEKNRQEEDKPWYYELRGKYGFIYPYGDTTLGVMVTSEIIKGRLKRDFKGRVNIFWDGDGEGVFLFNPTIIHEIAAMIKVRRKRQLSPEQRMKLVEAGQKYQFRHGDKSKITAQI
jgi:hypothetical protein